ILDWGLRIADFSDAYQGIEISFQNPNPDKLEKIKVLHSVQYSLDGYSFQSIPEGDKCLNSKCQVFDFKSNLFISYYFRNYSAKCTKVI
ncbi:MAG: hypothetical protein KAS94_01670, partial [Desulfobulbaceae bacterium]|nr:hypothetical protein [Desulfobulbaceae bacterium]